jgi:hypothetical protein
VLPGRRRTAVTRWGKLPPNVAAAAGRLVAHDYATLEQQFLDVAQAQVEAEGSAYRATDDHCRKAVAVIERCLLHRPILRDLANVTVPSSRP